jgi:NADH-quinone oxidoreductase subunit C
MINEIKKLGEVYMVEEKEIWVKIEVKNFIKTIERLKELGVERINTIAGIDKGDNIEILYQFFHNHFITVKTSIPKKLCKIPSITKYFPGANLFERELAEMFGIDVIGHPEPKKLFLSKEIEKPMRR